MSKKKAHVIITLFDAFSLFGLWWGYSEVDQIITGISNFSDMVSFNNKIGFFIFGVGLPIAHIIGIIEYFWPNILIKRTALINQSFIILGIALFVMAFGISAFLKTYVESAGYQHCPKADKNLSFSTYLVYTKDTAICSQLVEENLK